MQIKNSQTGSRSGDSLAGATGHRRGSVRRRATIICAGVLVAIAFGGAFVFLQIETIRDAVVEARELDQKRNLFHQLHHLAQMVQHTESGGAGQHDRLHYAAELFEDKRRLIDELPPAERGLVDLVQSAIADPSARRVEVAAKVPEINELYAWYVDQQQRGSESFESRMRQAELGLLFAVIVLALMVTVPPLILIGDLVLGLSRLKQKVDAAQSGQSPHEVIVGRVDEIGEVAHALDQMYALVEDRQREQAAQRALLARQEQLASMINVTGGIAHEISNPLNVLLANLEMLEERLRSRIEYGDEQSQQLDESITALRDALLRIETMMHRITALQMAENQDEEAVADINDVLRQVCDLVNIGDSMRRVQVDTDLSLDVGMVAVPSWRLQPAMFVTMNAVGERIQDTGGVLTVISSAENGRVRVDFKAEPNPETCAPDPFAVAWRRPGDLQLISELVSGFDVQLVWHDEQGGLRLSVYLPEREMEAA